jgi:hypothetical protein
MDAGRVPDQTSYAPGHPAYEFCLPICILPSVSRGPLPVLTKSSFGLRGISTTMIRKFPISNEHVVSSLSYAKKHQSTVTDSVFRVVRTSSGTLTESHEIQAVNDTPAKGEHVDGPTSLSGVFTGGLDAVSLRQSACMSYTLQPIDPGHPNEPYVIQFTTLPNTQRRSDCVLKEEGAGRVFVDPATMQVTRMELRAPNHTINPSEVGICTYQSTMPRSCLLGRLSGCLQL